MNPYTERTILLGLLSVVPLFCSTHLRTDKEEEAGFQTLLCMHQNGIAKVFTWHISDQDLEYLPPLKTVECNREHFDTETKYQVLSSVLKELSQ